MPSKIFIGSPASGTPPSAVTSHVSCMYRHACPSAEIACGCIDSTIPASSTVSSASPIFGNSIIVIPIEWPVTWPRVKPRSRKPFATARCASRAVSPARSAAGAAAKYSSYASIIRFVSSLGSPGQIARETSTQWPPGPATSSDGRTQSVGADRRACRRS